MLFHTKKPGTNPLSGGPDQPNASKKGAAFGGANEPDSPVPATLNYSSRIKRYDRLTGNKLGTAGNLATASGRKVRRRG